MTTLPFIKAHGYGNDFLYVLRREVGDADLSALACTLCDRHWGIGADGLIVYALTPRGASMVLRNSDGSRAEVSGNGVRGLAAILARQDRALADRGIVIVTESGEKTLTLEGVENGRYTFRATMGQPKEIAQQTLDVGGERVLVTTLSMGNPQCVILGSLDAARFERLGPALEHHAAFPQGTNVEFVHVDAPDRLRILIWERGAGPTQASGTGACASAVAAAAHGGASRDIHVTSPGGTQRVEWREEGVYLTGWAEVTAEGSWLGSADFHR